MARQFNGGVGQIYLVSKPTDYRLEARHNQIVFLGRQRKIKVDRKGSVEKHEKVVCLKLNMKIYNFPLVVVSNTKQYIIRHATFA